MNEVIMRVNNLSYLDVVTNINLSIKRNAFLIIGGNNGSGKTTLAKLLSGKIPNKGSINFEGYPLESYNITTISQKIGLLLSENKVFSTTTVEKELLKSFLNTTISKENRKILLTKVIKLLKLRENLSQNPNNLSNTKKIYLELACILVNSPRILILDNPTVEMTKEDEQSFLNLIYELQKEGLTIVMLTSKLETSLKAEYLCILNNGRIFMEGEPFSILKQDNILNKLGLNIPFMVDLSVKLEDYGLIDSIELDMDKLTRQLWK